MLLRAFLEPDLNIAARADGDPEIVTLVLARGDEAGRALARALALRLDPS